ncbi:unnamed protein product, partial [Iphiclides podalirius]
MPHAGASVKLTTEPPRTEAFKWKPPERIWRGFRLQGGRGACAGVRGRGSRTHWAWRARAVAGAEPSRMLRRAHLSRRSDRAHAQAHTHAREPRERVRASDPRDSPRESSVPVVFVHKPAAPRSPGSSPGRQSLDGALVGWGDVTRSFHEGLFKIWRYACRREQTTVGPLVLPSGTSVSYLLTTNSAPGAAIRARETDNSQNITTNIVMSHKLMMLLLCDDLLLGFPDRANGSSGVNKKSEVRTGWPRQNGSGSAKPIRIVAGQLDRNERRGRRLTSTGRGPKAVPICSPDVAQFEAHAARLSAVLITR